MRGAGGCRDGRQALPGLRAEKMLHRRRFVSHHAGMSDPTSLAGKHFPLRAGFDVVVAGAGEAGIAAALEARRDGASVLLVDEHPLDPG